MVKYCPKQRHHEDASIPGKKQKQKQKKLDLPIRHGEGAIKPRIFSFFSCIDVLWLIQKAASAVGIASLDLRGQNMFTFCYLLFNKH